MSCPYGNIVNFSHMSRTFLGEQYVHSNEWGRKCRKILETAPFPGSKIRSYPKIFLGTFENAAWSVCQIQGCHLA